MQKSSWLAWIVILLVFAGTGTAQVTLVPLGTYASGDFDGGASEIVAYDPKRNGCL